MLRAISALMFRVMIVFCLVLATSVGAETGALVTLRPPIRDGEMPNTRWSHKADHALWNRAALSALKTHGRDLVEAVPGDIATWCPSYPESTGADRRGFWVGFLSTLAKHESTYKSGAVGGGGSGCGRGAAKGCDGCNGSRVRTMSIFVSKEVSFWVNVVSSTTIS